MDVQYRNWYLGNVTQIDGNSVNAQGTFRALQSFALDDRYRVVEGLLVDAVHGGLGFRNHTVPVGLSLGAQWTEDLLWLEPETACTSTNLTLHFSVSKGGYSTIVDGYFVDDGGFANISPIPPEPRWDLTGWREIGPVPNLQHRADVAAWWNNQLVANNLNITSSVLGQKFDNLWGYALLADTTSLRINLMNGNFLNDAIFDVNGSTANTFEYYGTFAD